MHSQAAIGDAAHLLKECEKLLLVLLDEAHKDLCGVKTSYETVVPVLLDEAKKNSHGKKEDTVQMVVYKMKKQNKHG